MGDSGQGFINAILFVVFTSNVRKRLLLQLSCVCCKWWKLKKHGRHDDKHSVQHAKSNSRFSFKSSDPIGYESNRYSTLPQEEVMNSVTSEENLKGQSDSTTVSDYFPVSFK